MKNLCILSTKQLIQWKNLLMRYKNEDILEQIDSILYQIGNEKILFKKIKITSIKESEDANYYSIDAWEIEDESDEGIVLANIVIHKNGTFDISVRNKYKQNQDVLNITFKALEQLINCSNLLSA